MCEYTGNCEDLVKARNRVIQGKANLKLNHPKLHNKLNEILFDIQLFMDHAITHLDKLYEKEKFEVSIVHKQNEYPFVEYYKSRPHNRNKNEPND